MDSALGQQLVDLKREPAYQFLVNRIGMVRDNYDKSLHSCNKFEDFLVRKGRHEAAEDILRILKDPLSVINNGVVKTGVNVVDSPTTV